MCDMFCMAMRSNQSALLSIIGQLTRASCNAYTTNLVFVTKGNIQTGPFNPLGITCNAHITCTETASVHPLLCALSTRPCALRHQVYAESR